MALNRKLGNHAWETINLSNIGELLIKQRDFDAAQRPLEQALARSREIGNRSLKANALANMAMLAERRGDHDAARTLGIEALAIYRNQVAPAQEAEQLLLLARAYVASGEAANAALYLRRRSASAANLVTVPTSVVASRPWPGRGARRRIRRSGLFKGAAHHLREVTGVAAPPSEHEYAARDAARAAVPRWANPRSRRIELGPSRRWSGSHTALEWLAGSRGGRDRRIGQSPPDAG